MSTDLSVSMDRGGIVVETYRETSMTRPGHGFRESVTLSPDEARTIASELNEAADRFEQAEYQFPSRSVGGPR